MTAPRRILTLRAIAQSARARTGSPIFNQIDQEIQELGDVSRVTPQRRKHLLQVLHACRALETALREVLRSYGINPQTSLGPLFRQLALIPAGQPGFLTPANARRFGRTVRGARNRFTHQANAFPRSSREAEDVLSEIQTCFTLAVR